MACRHGTAILFSSGIASVPAGIFFGWLGDRIGRRKVFMITILTFSLATGLMAVTPERGWIFLAAMRFIVGLGVAGVPAVDLPLLQEYLPASKRGWISGLSISLIPAGGLLSATLSAYLGTIIGWRGLFAIGMLPALMAFVIRIWVPESPRRLLGQGRIEEARRSLAWALQVDPGAIALPAAMPETRKSSWQELFKYPRSLAAGILTGLSQTGGVGLALWGVTLIALVLKVTPAQASFLVIWTALIGIVGRVFGSWISDALGRRAAGTVLFPWGGANRLARRLSAQRLSRYCVSILYPPVDPQLLRQRRVFCRISVYGRAVAGVVARERFRPRLWGE